MNKVSYEDMINYLQDNVDTLMEMVNEVNSYNDALEEYRWEINDEEFYNIFFKDKMEVARAVYYGGNSYNYMEDYVRFDAYGNLETTDSYNMRRDLQDGASEILDEFLELYADDNVYTSDEVFKGMISDYYNMEDIESEEDL